MGSWNNTDNLGAKLEPNDHVGYIHGSKDRYRIHSGIVYKLCEKNVWIIPDEDFINDVRVPDNWEDRYKKIYPDRKITKYDKMVLVPYGRVVKLGY